MNHLPEIVGLRAAPPQVPLVCDPHAYDGGPFETFPNRKGYVLVEQDGFPKFILHADGTKLTSQELSTMTQAWLFFALLGAVLQVSGISMDPEEFVETQGTRQYITTKKLLHYMNMWIDSESSLPLQVRKAHYRRQQDMMIVSMCFQCHQISDNWFWDSDYGHQFFPLPIERYKMTVPLQFEISLRVLSETLDRASRKARGCNNQVGDPAYPCKSLIRDLRHRGWCPSEISLISVYFDDTLRYYASQLARRRLTVAHSNCSASKCLAFNVQSSEYKTQHMATCKSCADVIINENELKAILQRYQTPLVRIEVDETCDGSKVILNLEEQGAYVAISHVWSDGLGNNSQNSLPTCQLLRLHSLTKNVIPSVVNNTLIWIDTLLVPVASGPEKKLALSQLNKYYREATKVLVLDSDLLQASRYTSQEELMSRVFLCSWMRRLWTLEEAILSRDRLEFQFLDGVVGMGELMKTEWISSRLDNIGTNLHSDLKIFLPDIAGRFAQEPENPQVKVDTILDLLPLLLYRSTTKARDEPICMSHILGIDALRLAQFDEADLRMGEFFKTLAEKGTLFPRRLLFTNEPKLSMTGCCWAPESFMKFHPDEVGYLMQGSKKERCEYRIGKGLMVDGLYGIQINFETDQQCFKQVTFVELDSKIYALTPVPRGEISLDGDHFWSRAQQDKARNERTVESWPPICSALIGTSPRTTAIIFDSFKCALLVIIHYASEPFTDDPNDVILFAKPVSLLYMRELKTRDQNHIISGNLSDGIRLTNPNWDFEQTKLQMREELDRFYDPAISTFPRCRAVDPCQRWCIG